MRKELFRALVGSHNYNLSTPESDKDYKVFVLPTFDDLYSNKMYSKSIIGEEEDLDIHDARKLPDLLFKSNINFMEVLFSDDLIINEDLSPEQVYHLRNVLNLKEEIATMNLPYLFNACGGMYYQKYKGLEKGTGGTQHLVEAHGYCTKNALHAFRIMNVLFRYKNQKFTDFKKAIRYDDHEAEMMLEIKNGKYGFEEMKRILDDYHEHVFQKMKPLYHGQTANVDLDTFVKNSIKEIVKDNILY